MKPPAFQFYADDFLAGTFAMTNEERGLYITLLCRQWTQGHVTREEVSRLGSTVVQPSVDHVLTKFEPDENGKLRNPRLERERAKQNEFRAMQSAKGKASAQARLNRGSTVVQPEHEPKGEPNVNSPSPSPSPKNTYPHSPQGGELPLLAPPVDKADELPLDSHANAEAEAAVDWFLALLTETGAKPPKLTPSARHGWADAFDKLTRLDGHSIDRVKAVCRWARNDSFWRTNFMAPPKLREKKHGVSYMDQFANKMGQAPAGTPVQPLPPIPAPPNFRAFMAREYPNFNAYPVGQNAENCQWEKLSRSIQQMIADDMRKGGEL